LFCDFLQTPPQKKFTSRPNSSKKQAWSSSIHVLKLDFLKMYFSCTVCSVVTIRALLWNCGIGNLSYQQTPVFIYLFLSKFGLILNLVLVKNCCWLTMAELTNVLFRPQKNMVWISVRDNSFELLLSPIWICDLWRVLTQRTLMVVALSIINEGS
jgi:hypothetical protein